MYPCSPEDSNPVYYDGPPRICCLGFQLCDGKLQGLETPGVKGGDHQPVDIFGSNTWDLARQNAIKASVMMRRQGPFMPSILGAEEMEYTSRPAVLEDLKKRFVSPKDDDSKCCCSKKDKTDVE